MALCGGRGLAMPGNPRLGLVRHKEGGGRGRHFSCSTAERARQFASDPRAFVAAVERVVAENPCLERLLDMGPHGGLTHHFPYLTTKNEKSFPGSWTTEAHGHGSSAAKALVSSDRSAQTAVHSPAGGGRDPLYRWNEWDLRREALSAARGVASRRTHSAQTDASASRRSAGAGTATTTGGVANASYREERSTQTAR